MAPHFILEALNIDFELILVNRQTNAHKSNEYLALNPSGRIPTLIDEQLVLFESAAICIHLAESNPSARFIPNIGSKNRAKFFQWMMYLTNTVQAEFMFYFYPNRHTNSSNALANMTLIQEERITNMFGLLDNEVRHKVFLIGNIITACDFFLFMLAIWANEFKKPPLAFTHLSKYLCNLAKNDAIINVCKKENVNIDNYQ
jgi:glutathione S-transferase